MPLIIATTDFTDVAENAVNYACELALSQNADVLVMHSYSVPIVFSDLPVPTPIDEIRGAAEEAMQVLLSRLTAAYPQISIKRTIIYGDIVDGVEEYIANNGMPMMVIAGNGYSPENTAWLDSTLIDAFRTLKCPVMAVPAETTFTKIRKIGFAYDNKYPGSETALERLKEITKTLDAELHVLYAPGDVHTQDNPSDINDSAKRILSSVDPLYHFFFEEDVDKAIQDFASEYHLDMLVVIPRKHSFFEGLFHKSHTKVLVNNSHIPIMALHEN